MSPPSENVEIVRGTIDSLNRRDLDRAVEAAHEDFEADWSSSIAPHRGVYRGPERARELFESFLEAWEEFRWEPQEIIEVGGKVRHVKLYQSMAEALEAVGVADP